MLIKDFINYLKEYNPNAEIRICDDYCEYDEIELGYISSNNSDDVKTTKYVFIRGIQ